VQTVALTVAAIAFLALVLYRVRPRMGRRRRAPFGPALKAARDKLNAATTDAERASALCEAADACAAAFGRGEAAASYYMRAMRLAPTSVEFVERACRNLEHRPRVLEGLLWRKLGADADRKGTHDATLAALRGLVQVYSIGARNAPRARAVEGLLAMLEHEP
jgi:hypothetical protein